ncbi:MAG: sulfurtransferase-like selenium metabolism protein YedF [Oligoflexales bacterium]|nr:sulfurtransferase-like selenium metabolism protein YedF [Oligoflexales bacterium]
MTATDNSNGIKMENESLIAFTKDRMGEGDDDLGKILIRSFVHTLTEKKALPKTMVFYNTGAKLLADDSPLFSDFAELETRGVRLLVCGTCVNYFNLKEKIKIGTVSNMYEISDLLLGSKRATFI